MGLAVTPIPFRAGFPAPMRRYPISSLAGYRRAILAGRMHSVAAGPVKLDFVLARTVTGISHELTTLFCARTRITRLQPGSSLRLRGPAGTTGTRTVTINPACKLSG